jgi:methionyl-tRNA formyltransferase
LGLKVRHPLNFKDAGDQQAFFDLNADLAVVVAYGLILPQVILNAPQKGCWNIHASLLPRWRGAAPIHRAIMAGDSQTGICIMQMEAGLDTGPVLSRGEVAIDPMDTTASLHDKLAMQGADLIVEAIERHAELTPMPQSDEGVTYAKKIEKAEARVNWSAPAEIVDRQIRALSPFPGVWCEYQAERIKLLTSSLSEQSGPAGQVVDVENGLTVACGLGAVRVRKLQRAGKSAQDAEIFLRGLNIPIGAQLD